MSALLSQLRRFSSGTEKWHEIPFSVKIENVTWSVATDGHILLAVKASGVAFRKDYPPSLLHMLTNPANGFVEVNLEELKKWAGEAPTMLVPSGEVPFEHQGVLLGQLIDRRKLAYSLSRITTPVVHVWTFKPGILGFEQPSKQWRVFLAGLNAKPDRDDLVFHVQRDSASLSALELAELVDQQCASPS